MASRKIEIKILGDPGSLERAFGRSALAAETFGQRVSGVATGALKLFAKAAMVASAAVGVGLAVALKRGFDELAESAKVSAQTEAALKSTGGAAKVTADQISDLATQLSRMSGTDDEAIQAGENLLLTFTKVRNEAGKGNDIFNQATKAALDLSVAFGKDMNQSAILLGKALNDPISGLTALRRVGVQFDEGQKKQIKTMVEAGNVMGAQKLILAELTRETGGSAKAFGETLPGQLARARNAFDEVAGKLAAKFLPVLTNMLDWVNSHWPQISAVFDAVGVGVLAAIHGTVAAVKFLIPPARAVVEFFQREWPKVQAAAERVADWYEKNLAPTVEAALRALRAAWDRFLRPLVAFVRQHLDEVGRIFRSALTTIKAFVDFWLAVFRGDWGKAWASLKTIVSSTWQGIVAILKLAAETALALARVIGEALWKGIKAGAARIGEAALERLRELWAVIKHAAGSAKAFAFDIGRAIVEGILGGLGDLVDRVGGAIKHGVESAVHFAGRLLHGSGEFEFTRYAIGERLVRGISAGIEGKAWELTENLRKAVAAAIEKAAEAVRAAQDSFSGAWQNLADKALQAFDAATQAGLDRMDARLDARLQALDDKLAARLAAINARFDQPTPSEAALAAADEARTQDELAAALARLKDAEEELQAARAGDNPEARIDAEKRLIAAEKELQEARKAGDPARIIAAEQELKDARIAADPERLKKAEEEYTKAREQAFRVGEELLRKQAEQERKAVEEARAAAIAKATVAVEKEKERASKLLAVQKKNYEAERALNREHLSLYLEETEKKLEKHPELWTAEHKKLMRVLAKQGVDYKTAAVNLGNAFVTGLREGFSAVEKWANELGELIAKYLKTHSPTEKGPMSDLDTWWAGFAPTLISGYDQAAVDAWAEAATKKVYLHYKHFAFPALTDPADLPEVIRFGGAYGASGRPIEAQPITINIHGTVIGDDRRRVAEELALHIRDALRRHQARGGLTI